MPNLIDLFLSFRGRIGRKQWWLGSLIIFAATLVGMRLLNPNGFDLDRSPPYIPNLAAILWQLALIVPWTALIVKRFNDRGWPNWLGFAFGAAAALSAIDRQFVLRIPGDTNAARTAVMVVIGLAFVWLLIGNGFLRGTSGPNRYGPDPLQQNGSAR